jgi:hypothetical protein
MVLFGCWTFFCIQKNPRSATSSSSLLWGAGVVPGCPYTTSAPPPAFHTPQCRIHSTPSIPTAGSSLPRTGSASACLAGARAASAAAGDGQPAWHPVSQDRSEKLGRRSQGQAARVCGDVPFREPWWRRVDLSVLLCWKAAVENRGCGWESFGAWRAKGHEKALGWIMVGAIMTLFYGSSGQLGISL